MCGVAAARAVCTRSRGAVAETAAASAQSSGVLLAVLATTLRNGTDDGGTAALDAPPLAVIVGLFEACGADRVSVRDEVMPRRSKGVVVIMSPAES